MNTKQANILIVDDNPNNLRLLVGLLKEKGYQVRPVPNGKLALSSAQALPPDLILLDILMPEMDGYQVCQQLKDNPTTKNIPVIFISAINEVLDKVKAFAVGGVDYITKPFQVEEVLVRVENHLAICFLQKKLQEKNEQLENTLEQLQITQSQLVQSEKMAALGQLIAGIAHEINTPLGAIRSSIENITNFFDCKLVELPEFFREISSENEQFFLELIQKSLPTGYFHLSTKEKRQIKRNFISQLQAENIDNADVIADTLVDLGIYDKIEDFFTLLKQANGINILNNVYDLASVQKSSHTIKIATEKAAKIVFALKSYSRYQQSGEKIKTNITEGIETVLTLYHNQLKKGIEVVKNYQEIPLIPCYADELNQVWTNIIHNAIQAMDNQGILTIDLAEQEDTILVKITDNGPGIDPEIMPKIFLPFFTTKPNGEGTGLGLDIVKKIVEKHQGTIDCESVPGKTSFMVYLPLKDILIN